MEKNLPMNFNNKSDLKISFVGDISLNNDYQRLAEVGNNPFIFLNKILSKSNYLVGNLEAMLENPHYENTKKQTRLKVHHKSLELLNCININLLTLANNHVYDQLFEGFKNTIDFLEKNSLDYIGASEQNKEQKIIKIINEKKVAFLNYVHHQTNPKFPPDIQINVNVYNKKTIISEIIKIKPGVDYIVLILHWGLDNSRFPEPWQRKDAKEFINAGVDLIVGHHSHVLQGFEKINNSYVFYSLGNFAFAPLKEGKDHDLDRNRQRDSVILHWNIAGAKPEVTWDPIILDKLITKPSSKSKIKKLSWLIPFISNPVTWPLYKLYLNFFYKLYFYFFGNGRNPFKRFIQIDRNKLKKAKNLFSF
jgi:hypothetical protein